jgi:cobalamin synthase
MPTTGKGKPSLRVVTMQRAARAEQKESLVEETRAILEEARMVLLGIQALFGFQLIAVFNTRFDELAPSLQTIHLIALVAGAVSMSLVMTPAAYHRIAERGRLSSRFAELASWLIAAAMAPLALSIALDAFVVSVVIAGNLLGGAIIGAILAMMFVAMWFVWPAVHARRRHR